LLGAVGKTISSLYLLVSIERAFLHPWQFALATVLGFGAVLVGAWKPADEAAKIHPVAALNVGLPMEQSISTNRGFPWFALACLLLAGGCSALALTTGPAPLAFAAAFFVLVACASLAPAATGGEQPPRGCVVKRAYTVEFGADNLRRTVHRNGITVAALSSAIAMAVGLLIMINSFRQTVGAWIEQGIVADLFIAPASNEIVGLGANVPPDVVAWLQARAEVAAGGRIS
jgi:putative ABC transport system permease protein